jgi:hypothetical protein
MERRTQYAIVSGVILVTLLLTGVFTFLGSGVESEQETHQDITVIDGLQLDSLILLATSILAGILFLISVLAYLKDTRVRYLFVSGAFFLITVKALLLIYEEFADNAWLEPAAHILELGVVLLFFLGLIYNRTD